MNDYGQILINIVDLEGPWLVMMTLLMSGYAVKKTKAFSPEYIPGMLFIMGPILSVVFIGVREVGDLDPDYPLPWPIIAAWGQAICRGFNLAVIVWAFHAALIKKVETFVADKLGLGVPKPGTMSKEDKAALAAVSPDVVPGT